MIGPNLNQQPLGQGPARQPSHRCTSSHGVTGFLEGTVFVLSIGMYQCPCGQFFSSQIERPSWIMEVQESRKPVHATMAGSNVSLTGDITPTGGADAKTTLS